MQLTIEALAAWAHNCYKLIYLRQAVANCVDGDRQNKTFPPSGDPSNIAITRGFESIRFEWLE
jgi:hypothetical protein